MPATAQTRAPLPAPAGRAARFVLLAALGVSLTGLALPGSATTAARSSATGPVPTALTSLGEEPRPPHGLQLVAPDAAGPALTGAQARPRPRRASRSRSLTTGWVRPVAAGIVSPYGMRWGRLHPGVDFGAHEGAPIHAVGPGVVIGAGYLSGESGYGQLILIRHAGGVVTAYAHTSRMFVHAGDRVQAGDTIGLVGATGHVTGPHLHFEVRLHGVKIDPVPWLRAHGVRV